METATSITLWNNQGRSDKLYIVNLEKTPLQDKYTVNFSYGRRGSSLVSGTKDVDVPYAKAERIFNSLIKQKQNGGYYPLSTKREFDRSYRNYLTKVLNDLFTYNVITKENYSRLHTLIESQDKSNNKLAEEIILLKDKNYTYNLNNS